MTLDPSELTIMTIPDAILPDRGVHQLLDPGQRFYRGQRPGGGKLQWERKSAAKLPQFPSDLLQHTANIPLRPLEWKRSRDVWPAWVN